MSVCFKNITLQLYNNVSKRRNFSGVGKEKGIYLGIGPDKVLPANNYISWNTSNAVKIRMEDSAPGNYPPILVQTMMRYAVSRYVCSCRVRQDHFRSDQKIISILVILI